MSTRSGRDRLARKPLSQFVTPKSTRKKESTKEEEVESGSESSPERPLGKKKKTPASTIGKRQRATSKSRSDSLGSPPTSDHAHSTPSNPSLPQTPNLSTIIPRNVSRKKDTDNQTTPVIKKRKSLVNVNETPRPSHYFNFRSLTPVVLVVVVALIYAIVLPRSPLNLTGKVGGIARFKRDLEQVKLGFPSQPNVTWIALASTMRKILDGRAKEPACILFMHDAQSRSTAHCLMATVANVVHAQLKVVDQEEEDSGHLTVVTADKLPQVDADAKVTLHESMANSLHSNHVVSLASIEDLRARVAMILHGFCDEGFDRHKEGGNKNVILMSLMTNTAGTKSTRKTDEHAAQTIKDLWEKDLGVDKVHPLITRIAANVLSVNVEDNLNAEMYCP